jgi:hypothetical protein
VGLQVLVLGLVHVVNCAVVYGSDRRADRP